MTYTVKEMFYTLQGEGANAGRPAVFCRFSGCNLWSGREQDRAHAICSFCDTDFVGTNGVNGAKFRTAIDLADQAISLWPDRQIGAPLIVCTGGEPLLQIDTPLIDALHAVGFEIAVETNGTLPAPTGIDWICVSPKAEAELLQTTGDELKLVYPQATAMPERFEHLAFRHFFLQPMDGLGKDHLEVRERNTQATLDYCLKHPKWRLGLQTHKILDIP